ncbi:MAG TPA: hypothetical protein VD931_16300 [Baekduia sp.]|nr:hypothetical protein [Baekduia sp.]
MRRMPPAGRLVGVSVALAALTLLAPSAPTYDPWAWIVWGREITQLDLSTVHGPSWKPLPVAFTTLFAPAGSFAPELWLVVARAGHVAAALLAFAVARRLGGGWAGGLAAAVGILLAPWMVRNAALGNSEPLLVALLLGAVDRQLAGRHRAAFALGAGAGLLRPEAWPFLGVYGLWLLWRRRERSAVVVGAGAATVALWTLPELWGSGDPLRAMSRAQDPNPGAAAFADDPVGRILSDTEALLVVPVELGLLAALVACVVRRDRRLAAVLALGAAWLAIVTVMTADGGFSGNQRYLIPPAALAVVAAGAGAGWALGRLRAPAVAAAAVLAAAAVAATASGLEETLDRVDYQARLHEQLEDVVGRAGGADAILRCGRPFTGPFLVPAVAWQLEVHTTYVGLEPQRPAVVFRVRTERGRGAVPSLRPLDATTARTTGPGPLVRARGPGPVVRTLAVARDWRIVGACRRGMLDGTG